MLKHLLQLLNHNCQEYIGSYSDLGLVAMDRWFVHACALYNKSYNITTAIPY